MKSLVIAITIAFIIIFAGIYSTNKLSDISEYLIELGEEIREKIEEDDFVGAKSCVDEMKKCVEENYNIFATTIDHNEIDKIEMNVNQMRVYIEKHQKADALAFANVLDGLFEHLPKDYKLKLENIL